MRRSMCSFVLCSAGLCLALGGPAHADPPAPAATSAAAAQPEDATFTARTAEAVRRYQQQDYAFAATEFQALYRIRPEPNLLYDAAYALLWLGRPGDASPLLQRFLREAPEIDATTRMAVEAEIARCRRLEQVQKEQARMEEARLEQAPPEPARRGPPPMAGPAPARSRLPLWTSLGLAGGFLAAAAVTGGLALWTTDEVHAARYVSPVPPDVTALQARAGALAISTDVLLGAGALALAGGLIAYYAPRRAPSERPRLTVIPGWSGAAVAGRF